MRVSVLPLLAVVVIALQSPPMLADCPPAPALPDFVEYAVPTADAAPLGITTGPDCAVWFTESMGNKIGRITSSGTVTEFTIPTPASNPSRIVTGHDGALWFTESDADKIGRITTAGVITEFPLPTAKSFPLSITPGPDGNLWFTEMSGHKIGRMTPGGVVTEFAIAPLDRFSALPRSIVSGPDGNLWFSELFNGRVGRITTSGEMTLFIVEPSCCASLGEIIATADGNLWFTEQWDNQIVKLATSGAMTAYKLSHPGDGGNGKSIIFGIAAGAGGDLWFTTSTGYGRMTRGGSITEAAVAEKASPEIMTAGPDGAVWFTERVANKIARQSLSAAVEIPSRHRSVRH